VKGHALTQLESPGDRVEQLPARREGRPQDEIGIDGGQALIDLPEADEAGGLVDDVRVPGQNPAAPAQRSTFSLAAWSTNVVATIVAKAKETTLTERITIHP
jgi:hypothetical protein